MTTDENIEVVERIMMRDRQVSAIATVEGYLSDLDLEFCSTGIQSLHDRWQRVVAIQGQYIQ